MRVYIQGHTRNVRNINACVHTRKRVFEQRCALCAALIIIKELSVTPNCAAHPRVKILRTLYIDLFCKSAI